MLELLGIVLVIVGTFLGFRSALQVTGANKDAKIPWSGRVDNQPRSAPLLRGLASALVLAGSLCLFGVLGAGMILLVVVLTTAPLLVFVAHNRRLDRAAP